MKPLPFTPPFRVLSDSPDGTDAHVIDAYGNVVIATSEWMDRPERHHKRAMEIICGLLNDNFPDASRECGQAAPPPGANPGKNGVAGAIGGSGGRENSKNDKPELPQ